MRGTAASDRRLVLMVAYLYPPIENTGTQRLLKFNKYLPEFGYRPVVLTTRTRGELPDDAGTFTFRSDDLLGPLKRAYRAVKLRGIAREARPNLGALHATGRLVRWQSTYLAPDNEIIWYPTALQHGRKILRSHPVEILYSTSSPETNHLVALKLKKEFRIPWVADFRDGWMFEPLRADRLRLAYRRRIEARLERSVVLNADCIVTVNETIADDFAARYPRAANKIKVITNGYDPADLEGIHRNRHSDDVFRLVHTGSFALSRAGTSLLGLVQAMQAMREQRLSLLDKLQVSLVGSLAESERQAIEQANLGDYFFLAGQLPHREALQHQVDADALLLVTASGSKGVSTSKLYEYLAIGRPILALSRDSPATRLISELSAGIVVPPDDPRVIRQAIETLYTRWSIGDIRQAVDERVRQFERRELTKRLATIFDELAGRSAV